MQIEQQAFKTIFAEVISKDEASDSSLQMGCIGDCVILHPENKITSNPQPIGFSGILLAKRQNSFYCTY
ncbi:hypothetical protein, partial [Segatella copri]|uniref:hypothetical protein n=1 Tax=Segatella copri TaxID=165179 RepID=UPI001C00D3AE